MRRRNIAARRLGRLRVPGPTAAVPVLLALLFIGDAHEAIAQVPPEPVPLRLTGELGDAATYRYAQDLDIALPPLLGGKQSVRSMVVLQQTIASLDQYTIRFATEVGDIALDLGDMPLASELDPERIRGRQFEMTLSRSGRLLDLAIPGEAAASAQIRQSVRQAGFPMLPEGPVRPGDTWFDTTRVEASGMGVPISGEVVSVSRMTLERLNESGGSLIALISVATDFAFEPGPTGPIGMEVAMTGSRADNVQFDVTRGRFVAGRGVQGFTLTMGNPGTAGAMKVTGSGTSRADLIDP